MRKLIDFIKKHKGILSLGFCLLLYVLFLYFTGIGCPIKFISGLCCPGCGMTRAVISAIKLDFKQAFYYHPLWCAIALIALLLILLRNKKRAFNLCIGLTCVLLISVYFFRIFSGNDIVYFRPNDGFLYKLYSKITNHKS